MTYPPPLLQLAVVAILVLKTITLAYTPPEAERLAKLVMQILLSIALVAASLFIVLSVKYTAQDQHWAYGTLGTVLGFWLRGAK